MNAIFLSGRCGKDPYVREVGENKIVIAEFSMATSKPPFKKGDLWPTEWHNVKCWRKAGEKVRDLLKKGDLVAIVGGEAKTEQWEKDGQKRQRSVIEVAFADNIVIEKSAREEEQY
jgi:single stranded DNA-binding protein